MYIFKLFKHLQTYSRYRHYLELLFFSPYCKRVRARIRVRLRAKVRVGVMVTVKVRFRAKVTVGVMVTVTVRVRVRVKSVLKPLAFVSKVNSLWVGEF